MKCLLLADNRTDLLATLEPILKHWGYRVLSASKAEQASSFLTESAPCLLIIGQQLLTDKSLMLGKNIIHQITSEKLPLIMLTQEDDQPLPIEPSEQLDVPVDIFALYSFIQRQVEKHPRQNLRLRLRLPGMYLTKGAEYVLSDVLSLSTDGLFLKSSLRLNKGDKITVVLPLLGHHKELELEATVLYTILPEASNNFMQGFGVGFSAISDEQQKNLRNYIEEHFLKEVSASNAGVGMFSQEQLKR